MKKCLLKTAPPYWYWKYPVGILLVFWFAILTTNVVSAQTVVVTGNTNNINIKKINLLVGSERFEQTSPTNNVNPIPANIPVLIESVVLETDEEIFVTSRRPVVTNPNPVLGTDQIAPANVEIINSNKPFVGHRQDDFLEHLEDVVSTADLRSYWSIGSQPSIPQGERFVDLHYPFPSSGYILFSERNGNSSIDFVPLGLDGRPVPGATTVQIRGYQWNTGVNHVTDNPSQKQWLVVFPASLFNTLQPIAGVRVVSINEPDGKLVFFVGDLAVAPDYAGPVNNQTESKAVLNVLDNDEINQGPVQRFDVDLTVITPFPDNTLIFNDDGTVDVPAGTPAGVYTMTYQITDVVGGESAQSTATVRVFEMMPEANDDNAEATAIGASALIQVLDNDWINGEPANLNNVNLSQLTNSSNGVLTLNNDGTIDVAPGTASGSYRLTYQICDKSDSSKCDTAVVTVFVDIREVDAADDNFGTYNQNGVLGNVLINDRINGIPVSPNQVAAVITDTGGLSGLTLQENGVLRVPGNIAPGSYVLEYELSEVLNPTNKDSAEVRFVVSPDPIDPVNEIDAVDDDFGTYHQNGIIGNVLVNDKINGGAVTSEQVVLNITDNGGLTGVTIDATGVLRVSGTVAAGSYLLEYELTEALNPDNKDLAKVRFVVSPDPTDPTDPTDPVNEIDAVDDDFGTYDQHGVIGNVLANDKINGVAVNSDQVVLNITDNGGLTGVVIDATGVLRLSKRAAPGSYVLEYRISETADPDNNDVAKVRFVVNATLITLVNDVAETNQNQAVTIAVLKNDKTESQAFNLETLEVTVAPSNGTSSINDDGTVTYAPASNFNGEDEFTYSVCDGVDGTACSTAVVTVTVKPILIDITKTVDKTNISVGETLTYTVTVTNNSDFAVENVVVEDLLPDLLLYASSSPAPAEDNTWIFTQMAAGESFSMTIDAVAVSPGEVTNTATLNIGEYEASAESPSVTIGQLPVDLKISKTSNDAEIYQGNEFEYEIRVENVGTSLATDVTVTDDLPAGLTYINSSYTASSDEIEARSSTSGNQISWTIASFPAGATLTITLKVQAGQVGVKTNTVEVSTREQEELNPEDNIAQDTNEVLTFFVPNVITPGDRDNKNDEFVIKGIERFAASRLVIFNRWGNHVFEADNYQNNWDAQGLTAGSYFYVLELTDSNGKTQTFKGWVQVIKD
jgi:uncharacterized repeat protein (TIGR01451 family)/gliding motility-associated-like protein